MDSIHDVTLQAADRTFPAHKYILSMRSEFFRKLFMSEGCEVPAELDGEVRKSEDAAGCDLIIFEKIPADMLEHALHFIYTDSCELLVHGAKPRGSAALTGQNQVRLDGKKGKRTKQPSVASTVVEMHSDHKYKAVLPFLARTWTKRRGLSAACRTWG